MLVAGSSTATTRERVIDPDNMSPTTRGLQSWCYAVAMREDPVVAVAGAGAAGGAGIVSYAASKGAIEAATRSLALELASAVASRQPDTPTPIPPWMTGGTTSIRRAASVIDKGEPPAREPTAT